jgi:23S rRNA (adenine2503-C2)-methyltransferase
VLGKPGFEAFGLTPSELVALGASASTFSALHRPWLFVGGAPALSRRDTELLSALGCALPNVERSDRSSDGSTKLLVSFGRDRVETVHMPRAVRSRRVTLCVSSQVGCAMGCTFCATAKLGFRRHLSAGEIVSQVSKVVHELGPRHPGELTLVFMGMGEPLHNLGHVARALEILCHPLGLGLSPRRITVSTAGLVPDIDALAELRVRPLLAVSLNATTDATRSSLMPIGRKYPLAELAAALSRYPLHARERITIEYVLLAGVNDSAADAARLFDFCQQFPHQINLIPWNAHAGSEFTTPSDGAIDAFARAILARGRALVTVRRSRGQDVAAACGQLAALG